MRSFVILLAVCAVGVYSATLTDEQKAKLREYKDACIAETGVDQATIDRILKGEQVPRDDKINCYAACILKKIGIMRADGTIDVEVARSKAGTTNVDLEKANKVIDKCKDLTGKDTCETGGKVFECFLANKDFKVLD